MSDYKNGDTASWDASQVRRSQAGHTGRSQGNPSQQPQRWRRAAGSTVLYILCVLVASAILAGVGWLLASDLCAFSRDIPSTTKINDEITADDDMGSIVKAAGRRTDPLQVVLPPVREPSPAPAKRWASAPMS